MRKQLGMMLGALLLAAPAAMAADAGTGKANFEKLCVSCHGADGKGNPVMTKVFGEKELNIATKETAAKKDDELIKVITEGRGKMPASAAKTLSKENQKALIGHVRSLGK